MSKNGLDEEFEGYEELEDEELFAVLDDDRRLELDEMVGLKVLGIELYEDSIGDEEDAEPVKPEERMFFDCDLYLDDNQALELYVTSAYPDPDGDPVSGMDTIFTQVGRLADEKLELLDFGEADEDEGGLALAFGHGEQVKMVLVCSAWMVREWVPDEEAGELEG